MGEGLVGLTALSMVGAKADLMVEMKAALMAAWSDCGLEFSKVVW